MDIKPFYSDNPPRYYPKLTIGHIKNPNRIYAFPIFGGLIKILLTLPVIFWLAILTTVQFFILIINSFVVLFTGKYWRLAYRYSLGLTRLNTKLTFFLYGLTNRYPGFVLDNSEDVKVDIAYPEKPNRLFAIPFLGFFIRGLLMIPYLIYQRFIGSASLIGVVASFVPVLFKGYYPESTYELARDEVRVSQGSTFYFTGIKDTYPSFYISLNHKRIKILLIILGILSTLPSYTPSDNKKLEPNNLAQPEQLITQKL